MNWESCKTQLQAIGLLYSPGDTKLSDDPCPLEDSATLKELMTEISDVLTGGSIRIPISPLAKLRFQHGYFEIIQYFLKEFYNHLFKRDSIKMKTRIVQKWSLKKYKEIFSSEERSKLEDDTPSSWDLVLLYKVIQVECWRMHGHEWMVMNRLINLLKTQLHQVAHKKLTIDKAEIVLRTTYLSKILNKICMEGSKIHRVQHRDMKNLSEWIDPAITTLTLLLDRKNLSKEDFDQIPELESKIARFKSHLEFGLKYRIKRELFMCHLLYFSPSKLFSKFLIENNSRSDCIQQEIDYNNIFTIKLKDGSTPDMYIISGPRAAGKSIYLKYISQQSYEDPMSVPEVEQFDVIFTAQFRDDVDNLQELIKQKLPNTLEEMGLDAFEIENVILQGNILIMIDGYDEVTAATHKLLKELMSYESNIKIICATRTEDLAQLLEIIPPSRNYVHIIPKPNTLKENCTKEENPSLEKNICFFDDTDNKTWDMNSVRDAIVWEKPDNMCTSADKEPKLNELSTQVLKLCSFVERLLGASMIIKKCKGKIDENTMKIFQDLLSELKDFRNQTQEFLQYSSNEEREGTSKSVHCFSNEEREGSSKTEHCIYEILVDRNKKKGSTEINIPSKKIEEMKSTELLILSLLDNPEIIIKRFKDEKYYESKMEFKEKEPNRQMIFASMEILASLGSKAADFSFLIEHKKGHIDNDTKKAIWELVEEIQDLREQCENYNYSLPANVTKKLPFTGLQYWFRKITSPYLRQDLNKHCSEMIHVIDTGDKKLRRYLLTPEKALHGPKLAEPWKGEADIEDIEKKSNWKQNSKGKKSKIKKKKP